MLNSDDLRLLRGLTISDAEAQEQEGKQVLRLHFMDGTVLAIAPDTGVGVNLADQSSDSMR